LLRSLEVVNTNPFRIPTEGIKEVYTYAIHLTPGSLPCTRTYYDVPKIIYYKPQWMVDQQSLIETTNKFVTENKNDFLCVDNMVETDTEYTTDTTFLNVTAEYRKIVPNLPSESFIKDVTKKCMSYLGLEFNIRTKRFIKTAIQLPVIKKYPFKISSVIKKKTLL